MRGSNGDNRIKLEPQRPQATDMGKAVTGQREQLAAGYHTLDRAPVGDYTHKERKGLAPDANYPRRHC